MDRFLECCRSRSNVTRAVNSALIVGPALAIINQSPLLWHLLHGQTIPAAGVMRIALTFAVPFLVSLYSSARADEARASDPRLIPE